MGKFHILCLLLELCFLTKVLSGPLPTSGKQNFSFFLQLTSCDILAANVVTIATPYNCYNHICKGTWMVMCYHLRLF